MKVAFSGTRRGMTPYQLQQLDLALAQAWRPGAEFHHGDCIGADVEAHEVAKRLGYLVVAHPSVKDAERAFVVGADRTEEPFDSLKRNDHIRLGADLVIAAPGGPEQRRGSGTWSVIRRARKASQTLIVIPPQCTEAQR